MFCQGQGVVVLRTNLTTLQHYFWTISGWPPMDKKSRPCKYTP